MSKSECHGCSEYLELSRRQFLGVSGAGVVAASLPAWLPRVALAGEFCSSRDVIVSIFLRGAADAMTFCAPFGEDAYYDARPTLSIPRPDSGHPMAALDLDGFFGMPPYMSSLIPAYANGDLLFVHACGSTDISRSHFDAMKLMEFADPTNPGAVTGWLGRHLASTMAVVPGNPLRAVATEFGLMRTLVGAPDALPIPRFETFNLLGYPGTVAARRQALTTMYDATPDPLRTAAQTTQAVIDLLATIDFVGYLPAGGAVYPVSPFGTSLKASAALIKSDIGVEAIGIDIEGWDHHIDMGPFDGILAQKLTDLAAGLAAFHADLSAGNGRNFVVVVMSEFGRRVEENGSDGTDHGHGNAMIVLGNRIAGGRVLTQWPGLQPEQRFEGRDLAITIDYRDVLAEIVQNRLANGNLGLVFPNFTPTFRGVTESCSKGDLNCDGGVTPDDVPGFATALMDETAYRGANPGCNPLNADINGDGAVDGRDIQGFTQQILGE